MHPDDPRSLEACFEEGLEARRDGKALNDNPYAAGSAERREWQAGFCATVEAGDRDGPDDGSGPQRPL